MTSQPNSGRLFSSRPLRQLQYPLLFCFLSLFARANPMFTGSDCLNFTTIKPSGVCVSGNGTDGSSYFTAADDAAGPFVISGGATNAGSTSSLPTLTQTAGVGVKAFPGAFFSTADAKFWDTFTFSGAPAGGAMATLTFTSTFAATNGGSGSALLTVNDGGQLFSTGWNAPFPGAQSPLSLNLLITNGVPVEISVNIYAESAWYGSATVTDPLNLSLPDGITYTSAAGLQEFLAGGGPGSGGGQAPEPGTLSLFGITAAAAFAFYRRQQSCIR